MFRLGLIRRASTQLQYSQRCNHARSLGLPETDSCGIPTKPTWSVNDLLSSYPEPSITPHTFRRLHELSALIPPTEGTPEHEELKKELEELIRLVEAVRLVDVSDMDGERVPDGRIWAEGTGISLDERKEGEGDTVSGRALLQHAARVSDGMYVVDSDRTTKA